MKLRIFDKESAQKDFAPAVTINAKGGLISFSTGFAEKVNLTDKSKVLFLQDEEKPKDWFIQIDAKNEKAFSLRDNKSYLSFNNTILCRQIINSCELGNTGSFRFLMAVEPIKDNAVGSLYAILTKSVKANERIKKTK